MGRPSKTGASQKTCRVLLSISGFRGEALGMIVAIVTVLFIISIWKYLFGRAYVAEDK